jgi:protein-disulfide isomerase
VTIVEFADFQCPYSKVAAATVKRLFERFPQKLRLVWKDYPSSAHRYSDGAAQVAREVAVKQGTAAFWRAHDLLFAAGPQLQPPRLIKKARALGLEPEAVQAALDGAPYRAAIDADVDLAARLGVPGLPTFFVNGRRILDEGPGLEQLVAEELAEARRRIDSGVPAARLYEEFERGALEHGEDRRRVAMPDPGSRPSRGGPPRMALPVHEFCDLGNFLCALIEPVLRAMLNSYGDEVRLVWWDVSDLQQPEGARLARAVAGVGPRFWELHDLVLANQSDFNRPPPALPEIPSPAVLRRYARQIGADLELFDYVMATGNGTEVESLKQARALGMRPPSLVIDGEVHSGMEPPHLLRAAIDRALARRSPPAR